MAENGEVRFQSDDIFTGQTGTVDHQGYVIRGASLIKMGEAEGHGLVVDQTLLKQLQACGKEKGKVSINLDHGSGITSTCGFVTGFRIDGDKLRGDIHLLKSHKESNVILERAEKMPECFGLSVAFRPPDGNKKGDPVGNGKFAARCEKLMSVDLVCRPAANDSLFDVPSVDKTQKSMAKKKEVQLAEGEEQTEPTMQDVMSAINQLNGRLDQHEQFLGTLQGPQQEEEGPSLQDLVDMEDAELERLGLTRDEVNAAVQEVIAGMEGQPEGPQGEGQPQGEGELAPAGAATGGADFSPAGASGSTAALESLKKEVLALKNEQKLVKLESKRRAEEVELSQIEQKVLTLAAQRDQAIELAEKLEAENDALRLAVKTGTRPVKAGVDTGMRLFSANDNGELHEFSQRVKQLTETGKTEGEAIRLAQKENPGLHADWLASQAKKRVA